MPCFIFWPLLSHFTKNASTLIWDVSINCSLKRMFPNIQQRCDKKKKQHISASLYIGGFGVCETTHCSKLIRLLHYPILHSKEYYKIKVFVSTENRDLYYFVWTFVNAISISLSWKTGIPQVKLVTLSMTKKLRNLLGNIILIAGEKRLECTWLYGRKVMYKGVRILGHQFICVAYCDAASVFPHLCFSHLPIMGGGGGVSPSI